MVECLVSAGSSVTATNNVHETALHVAAVRGHCGIVRLLYENGAKLDQPDKVCRPQQIYKSQISPHLEGGNGD